MVTICTTSLTFNNSTFCPHSVFMCFVSISEQTAIISLYNINWLVFITETESVYCAVRTGSLTVTVFNFSLYSGQPATLRSHSHAICNQIRTDRVPALDMFQFSPVAVHKYTSNRVACCPEMYLALWGTKLSEPSKLPSCSLLWTINHSEVCVCQSVRDNRM